MLAAVVLRLPRAFRPNAAHGAAHMERAVKRARVGAVLWHPSWQRSCATTVCGRGGASDVLNVVTIDVVHHEAAQMR